MRKLSSHVTALLIGVLLVGLGRATARQPFAPPPVGPVSTAFTYQGRLMDGIVPADGSYQITFRLYAHSEENIQIGPEVQQTVSVKQGLFTTQLDFGPGVFDGTERWLEITVGAETLSPRQELTAAPYALYSTTAPWEGLLDMPEDFADGEDNDTTYTAGRGLTLRGTEFVASGSPISNTVIVAKGGGDFTSVQAAIDSITDAGPGNPYLVAVATGIYTEQVTLKPYVTVEGAGEGATVIRWTGGSQNPSDGGASATVIGANNAVLRHLTIESVATGQTHAVGMYNRAASPQVSDVTARASGGGVVSYGIYNTASSSPQLDRITVSASGVSHNQGIRNVDSSPSLTNSTMRAEGGASAVGVFNVGSSSPLLSSVKISALGGATSYGIRTNSNAAATLRSVTVNASGVSSSYGVFNDRAESVTMFDVTATVSGGQDAYAVYNQTSSPVMSNVTASASGGTSTYGVFNISSSPMMSNVTVDASNGSSNYGVYNDFSSEPTIRESVITGNTNSIYSEGTRTVKVANSQLIGPLSAGLICFDNYNGSLAAITCP